MKANTVRFRRSPRISVTVPINDAIRFAEANPTWEAERVIFDNGIEAPVTMHRQESGYVRMLAGAPIRPSTKRTLP